MGDFGSATEAVQIIDLFALQVFAKNLDRCNFRVLQQNLPKADLSPAVEVSKILSLDHFISAQLEGLRHVEAERLGRIEVDDQKKPRGLLYRQITRFGSLDNLVNVKRRARRKKSVRASP